ACFQCGYAAPAPDEADYVGIARNLAARGAFENAPGGFWPAYFRAPLLPYALAALFKLGAGIAAARGALCLLNALFPLFALRLARELGAPRWACGAAALAAAFHPLHVRLSAALTTDALAATLVAASLWAAVREARRGPSLRSRAALGLLFGAMVCLRTNLGLFAAGCAVVWLLDRRFAPRRRLPLAGVAVLAAFAVALPAAALRSAQEGRALFVTDGGSELLWRGNSSFARDYLDGRGAGYLDAYRAAAGGDPRSPEGAARARAAALRDVAAAPFAWLAVKARFLFETWRPWPTFDRAATRGGGDGGFAGDAAKLLWFALMDGCWLATALGRRRLAGRQETLLLAAALILAPLFGMVRCPDHRYRLPAHAGVLALAAAAAPCGRRETP
ncbi:MAG: glycosyltransferase family 39 protein, partial [Candidatus Polarisedimenticolia bacterium]